MLPPQDANPINANPANNLDDNHGIPPPVPPPPQVQQENVPLPGQQQVAAQIKAPPTKMQSVRKWISSHKVRIGFGLAAIGVTLLICSTVMTGPAVGLLVLGGLFISAGVAVPLAIKLLDKAAPSGPQPAPDPAEESASEKARAFLGALMRGVGDISDFIRHRLPRAPANP